MRECGLGVVANDVSTPVLVRALSALAPEPVKRYMANTRRAARP